MLRRGASQAISYQFNTLVSFTLPTVEGAIEARVALLWRIPDRRIERVVDESCLNPVIQMSLAALKSTQSTSFEIRTEFPGMPHPTLKRPTCWSFVAALCFLASAAGQGSEIVSVDAGFVATEIHTPQPLRAFQWSDLGTLWGLAGRNHRLSFHAFENARWTERTGLPRALEVPAFTELVFQGEVAHLLHKGGLLRIDLYQPREAARIDTLWPKETSPFSLPTTTPSLAQGPEGSLYLTLLQSQSTGKPSPIVARWDSEGKPLEIFSRGVGSEGGIAFDRHGQLYAGDATGLFHVPPGIDFSPKQRAGEEDIPTQIAALASGNISAVLAYDSDRWPGEHRNVLLAFDTTDATLKEFPLTPRGASFKAGPAKPIVQFAPGTRIAGLKLSPAGTVWFAILRGETSQLIELDYRGLAPAQIHPATPTTATLLEELAGDNQWRCERALRLLPTRNDIPASRGLHPTTRIHQLLKESKDPQARLTALWALHRIRFLEDDYLEETVKDPDPWVKVWTARLVGERRFPTSMAFKALMQLGDDTNAMVRSGSAAGARQFVSGDFVKDTPPAFPLREVFTGGVLSTLWFASEDGVDPVLNQQFWNAVRPISNFDPVHPLGFFQQPQTHATPLARYILRRLGDQLGNMKDPIQFEAGMEAIGKIPRSNSVHLKPLLMGLQDATLPRSLKPEQASHSVLRELERSENSEIRGLAAAVLQRWKTP